MSELSLSEERSRPEEYNAQVFSEASSILNEPLESQFKERVQDLFQTFVDETDPAAEDTLGQLIYLTSLSRPDRLSFLIEKLTGLETSDRLKFRDDLQRALSAQQDQAEATAALCG